MNVETSCDNDNLKLFGFSIHGCMKGYGRKVLLLEVSSSNKNLGIIAKLNMDASMELNGAPNFSKEDRSVQNIIVVGIKRFLNCNQSGYTVNFYLLSLNPIRELSPGGYFLDIQV